MKAHHFSLCILLFTHPYSNAMQREVSRTNLAELVRIIVDLDYENYRNRELFREYLQDNPHLINAHIKSPPQHCSPSCTLLTIAAQCNWHRGVYILLGQGADPEAADYKGNTPFHWVARQDSPLIAHALIKFAANISARNKRNETPLHDALRKGDDTITTILVDHGAKVDALDDDGWTPQALAAKNNSSKIIEKMIRQNIAFGYNDAVAALRQEDYASAFDSINHATTPQERLQRKTVLEQCLDRNQQLLITAQDKHGNSLLHRAAAHGWQDAISLLISRGAPLEARNKRGVTPLGCAARRSRGQAVFLLLAKGAEPDSKDIYNLTALADALTYSRHEVAGLLLSHLACLESDQTEAPVVISQQHNIQSDAESPPPTAKAIRDQAVESAYNILLLTSVLPSVLCDFIVRKML